MRFGVTGSNDSLRHIALVDVFCTRLDAILPRDRTAVDASTEIKVALRLAGTSIAPNDTAIAGHAIAAGAGPGAARVGEIFWRYHAGNHLAYTCPR